MPALRLAVLCAFVSCCVYNVHADIAANADSNTANSGSSVGATTYAANNGQPQYPSATYGSGVSYQPPLAYKPQRPSYYAPQQQFSAPNAYFPQPNFPAAAGFQNLPFYPQVQNIVGAAGFPGAFQSFQPLTPLTPILTPTEFNQALNQYVSSVQQQYANAYEQQQKQWEAWRNSLNAIAQPQMPASNVATATGGVSQDGNILQTASLYPENAANPNVHVQHTITSGSPGAYVGVSTASFSSTSDVNGVKTQQKGAYTTVNDNGKITTYKLE